MKYFSLSIILLLSFIIAVSYYNTLIESFTSMKDIHTFILLGDSILKNDAYVSNGKSVDELMKERTNGKSICLATDNSKIVDIYDQMNRIPEIDRSATIFLSIGGNDILTHYVDKESDSTDTRILQTMFTAYKKVVARLRERFPNSNIVLLDIYYPENIKYQQYHSIIKEWNTMVYDYATKNNCGVLRVSGILTKPDDFTFGIEPSATGSKKLVEAMLTSEK